MYRSDWDAAVRRADFLQHQLRGLERARARDADRIRALQRELDSAKRALARLRSSPRPEPVVRELYQPSNAATILILGIVSVLFWPVAGPFAWYYGNLEMTRIRDGKVPPGHAGAVQAGRALGVVGTVFLVILFALVISILAA